MSKRISNTDIISAINLYFFKKGKRLSNLQKSNREKLDSIIKKYNINLEELLVEVAINNEKDKEAKLKREEDSRRRAEEYQKEQEKKEQILMMKWNTLSSEDKERVKNIHYTRYAEETLRDNEKAVKESEKMEKEARERGDYVRRVNENTLCIKGINVITGWYSKIQSREEYEMSDEWLAKCHYNKKIINDLYEAEMTKQGFLMGDDGDFYKIILVKKKNRNKKLV